MPLMPTFLSLMLSLTIFNFIIKQRSQVLEISSCQSVVVGELLQRIAFRWISVSRT